MNDSLNGRTVVRWRHDLSREAALDKFADALTAPCAAKGLVNHSGHVARLDKATGTLAPVNLAALHDLIGRDICGERVVCRDGVWINEYYPFAFAVTPRPPHWDGKGPRPPEIRATEPDAAVLRALYETELPARLPPVVE